MYLYLSSTTHNHISGPTAPFFYFFLSFRGNINREEIASARIKYLARMPRNVVSTLEIISNAIGADFIGHFGAIA
jgi:hypothetical protein